MSARAGAGGTTRWAQRSCWAAKHQRIAPTSASTRPGTPPVPDATELELTAQELREIDSESIIDTDYQRERATLIADPTRIKAVLEYLGSKGFTFLASL